MGDPVGTDPTGPDPANAGLADDGPIDPEEGQYLRPQHAHLVSRSELFELEAFNLADGRAWLAAQRVTRDELLTQSFQLDLHRRMYGQVWTWAGRLRTRENNLGVAPRAITERWEQLLGDVRYWLDHATFDPDEACVRYYFAHREIQPFHDGNSRLGRVVVNKLAELAGLTTAARPRYPFGQGGDPDTVRREHLDAISEARRGRFGPLVDLARRGARST